MAGIGLLAIRADASGEIGTGHVMRTIALAQVWQERGGDVAMLMAVSTEAIDKRLLDESIQKIEVSGHPGSLDDAQLTLQALISLNATALVLDGYRFDSDYQLKLKTSSCTKVVIDDYYHHNSYHADFILNQTVGISPEAYSGKAERATLLLGGRYALLRREFRKPVAKRRYPERGKNILVTMGGSDPDNFTKTVLKALDGMRDYEFAATVVVGGSNLHWNSLCQLAEKTDKSISFERNITDMSPLMNWADVAITAGGSTCWELARFGVPMVISVLADNQRLIARVLAKEGVALNLGEHDLIRSTVITDELKDLLMDHKRREYMGRRASELIDGQGACRVVDMLISNDSDACK